MKNLLLRLLKYLKRQTWSLIVAYMVGLHNFYYGDNKSPDDIVITNQVKQGQEKDKQNGPPLPFSGKTDHDNPRQQEYQ